MGNSMPKTYNIVRVHVSNTAGGEEQSVVYTTSESKTCTLRVRVGVDWATISLRDYTFERQETGVDIKVRDLDNSIAVNSLIQVTYWGRDASVLPGGEEPWSPCIKYGYNAYLALLTSNYHPHKLPNHLIVNHSHPSRRGTAFATVIVWYNVARRRFCCSLTGPSWCSLPSEAEEAVNKALRSLHFAYFASSTTNQTAITATGLINNIKGEVYGDLNGSVFYGDVFYRPTINITKIVINNQGDTLPETP